MQMPVLQTSMPWMPTINRADHPPPDYKRRRSACEPHSQALTFQFTSRVISDSVARRFKWINASPGSLPSSNVVTDAAPLQGRGKGNNPRNLSKHAQDSNENLAPIPPPSPTAHLKRGAKTTRCPRNGSPMFRASAEHHRRVAARADPRILSSAPGYNQNLALNASAVSNGTSEARGKNHKAPAPAVAPNVPGGQGTRPSPGNGQGSAPRNLSKHAQNVIKIRASIPPQLPAHLEGGAKTINLTAPAAAPNVPGLARWKRPSQFE